MCAACPTPLLLLIASGLAASTQFTHRANANDPAESIIQSANAREGLCVHVGCGNGVLTAAIAKSGRYLVHGLSLNEEQVQRARNRIQSQKLYGVASVSCCSFKRLPYADNLANLIVVDNLTNVLAAGCSIREIMRILAPQGVVLLSVRTNAGPAKSARDLRAILRQAGVKSYTAIDADGAWAKITKPRPQEMDEWTHAKHGPDRNPVARDTLVQPPNNLRWISGPRWRGTSGVQLSSNGQIIYADGTVRDAFNGLRRFSLRRPGKYKYVTPLLAIGDRIYFNAPRASKFLQAAHAATGDVEFTYEQIKHPRGLAYLHGDLFFINFDGTGCVDAATGELKWLNQKFAFDGRLSHGASALVLAGAHVLVQSPPGRRSGAAGSLACLNRDTGNVIWKKSGEELHGELRLYAHGAVICCDAYRVYPKRVYSLSVDDGSLLWKSPYMNEGKSVGVYAIDGLIWCQHNRKTSGFDAATGKLVRQHVAAPGTFKCAQPAATTQFMPGGNLAFLDLKKGTIDACRIDRNACGADPGVLFCNGLTYSFPKQCSCFSMVRGYTAYTTDESLPALLRETSDVKRSVKGPAFDEQTSVAGVAAMRKEPDSWPAFRHDGMRSASTTAPVPLPLRNHWTTSPEDQPVPGWLADEWQNHPSSGGRVSSVVAANGLIFLSLTNSHRVAALEPQTGKLRWSFTAGGRVLTPPTIDGGLCYFGAQDGWAYCLRIHDGELVWKFRAAPAEHKIVAHGQLESLWPVSGGVLVKNGRAYLSAGRLSNLIGGLVGYALDARTARLIWKQSPPSGYKYTSTNKIAPAYRGDVPVSGDGVIQMGHPRWIVNVDSGQFASNVVPVRHRLVKPIAVPILSSNRDGLWDLSRSKQQGPTDMGHGFLAQEFGGVWAQQLVIRNDRIFGFQLPTIKTNYYSNKQSQSRNNLRLIAWDRSYKELWSRELKEGIELVAMIAAGDVLFATGTERGPERPYYKGILWALSTTDGSELARHELDGLPAGEGLVAAFGKLYVTLQDGRVLCLAKDTR